jgi:hypothetical protein
MSDSSQLFRVECVDESVDGLVRNVAKRCAAITRTRIHVDAGELSSDELRGYVRARAMGPTRLLIHELAGARRMSIDQENQLVARALDRTVHTVIREMSRPVVTAPPAWLPLRAAA